MNADTLNVKPTAILAGTFTQTQLPLRFRLRSWLQFSRWTEHLRASLLRSFDATPLVSIPAHGKFSYMGKQLQFDARNGQFSAICAKYHQVGYEFETSLLLLHLCRGSRSFFDVGANWGYFDMLLAATPWFEGQCTAFEPNPPVYLDLVNLIRQAGIGKKVRAVNIGIGAKQEELFLQQSNRFLTGLASFNRQEGVRIQVCPIDSIAANPPDIIKVDAEGMEMEVFTGAERTLREQKPHLIFESVINYQKPEETLRPLIHLQERGYQMFNPISMFCINGCELTANYDDPFDLLVQSDPDPKPALVPFHSKRRFVLRKQINVFACHKDRVEELRLQNIRVENPV